MPLSRQIEKFLQYCEVNRNLSRKTTDNYKHYLQRFANFVGEIEPRKITLDKVQEYRLFLSRYLDNRRRELSLITQTYHIIALRAFLKYLIKQDIKTLAPEKIELPRTPKRSVEVISREELDRIFETAKKDKKSATRDLAILHTLYSTGLRVSELVSLDRQQVDLKRREFMVRGKGNKPRIVFLSELAAESIEKYLKTRDDNFRPLFANNINVNIGEDEKRRLTRVSIEAIVRKHALRAGIIKKVTPHTLRHSYATELLINGADIRSVQEMLGHSSITTTQVYTHLTDKKLKEVHDKFHK